MEYMKKYIPILIGVAVLFAVVFGGKILMNNSTETEIEEVTSEVTTKSFVGQVVRVFEGEHVLGYSLDIPETASTSIDMDGARIRIVDGATPVAAMYFSYEGARGYSPIDYINKKIAPSVSVINLTSTSTIGEHEWQAAESEGSEWHVTSVANGQWLIVVENKKTTKDVVEKILTSISVK